MTGGSSYLRCSNDQCKIKQMINSIRPVALASLLAYGEVQNGSRPERDPRAKAGAFAYKKYR